MVLGANRLELAALRHAAVAAAGRGQRVAPLRAVLRLRCIGWPRCVANSRNSAMSSDICSAAALKRCRDTMLPNEGSASVVSTATMASATIVSSSVRPRTSGASAVPAARRGREVGQPVAYLQAQHRAAGIAGHQRVGARDGTHLVAVAAAAQLDVVEPFAAARCGGCRLSALKLRRIQAMVRPVFLLLETAGASAPPPRRHGGCVATATGTRARQWLASTPTRASTTHSSTSVKPETRRRATVSAATPRCCLPLLS